jgi:hypothetical protein
MPPIVFELDSAAISATEFNASLVMLDITVQLHSWEFGFELQAQELHHSSQMLLVDAALQIPRDTSGPVLV